MSEKVKTKKWRQGSEWEKRDESGRETTTRDRAARGTKRGREREGKKPLSRAPLLVGKMCPIFPVFTLPRPALAPPFSCMRKLFFAFRPRVDGSLLRSVRRSLARYIFLMQRESAKLGKYTLHYFQRERTNTHHVHTRGGL